MAAQTPDFRTAVRQTMLEILSEAQHSFEMDYGSVSTQLQLHDNWDIFLVGHYIGQWIDRVDPMIEKIINRNKELTGLSVYIEQEAHDGFIEIEVSWEYDRCNPFQELACEDPFNNEQYEAQWEEEALEAAKAELN